MATGFTDRFKGKIVAAQVWMGAGNSLVDAGSGIASVTDYIQKLAVQATANTTVDYGPMSMPVGRSLLSAVFYTTVGFGAVTDAKVSIGASAGGQDYVAQTSVKALGTVNLTLVTTALVTLMSMTAAAPNLFVRITQSGGNSATGTGVLIINYA